MDNIKLPSAKSVVLYIPDTVTPVGPFRIASIKLMPFPVTSNNGTIPMEIRKAIFKKKPCIPKNKPSILTPDRSCSMEMISLNIAGGNINAHPEIGMPINPNNHSPLEIGITFPK